MGVMMRGRKAWFVKRIPKRYRHLFPEAQTHMRRPAHTDSRADAERRWPQIEAEWDAHFRALAAGRSSDAARHLEVARSLAEARGFAYITAESLADGPFAEIARRLEALFQHGNPTAAEADALLGTVAAPPLLFTAEGALEVFFEASPDLIAGKSPAQAKHWRQERGRAMGDWERVMGQLPMQEIGQAEAVRFRAWCAGRIAGEGEGPAWSAESANKRLVKLSGIWNAVSRVKGLDLESPFKGLLFKAQPREEAAAYSRGWIAERILAPGALDAMVPEAADIIRLLVNTGFRPSEPIDARPEDFVLEAEVPHLVITPYDGERQREIKNAGSRRAIPLLGMSLEAAHRLKAAGGCVRYRGRPTAFSNYANKQMRALGLAESPRHTVKGFRHGFENALLDAGVDDRIRADLMGHAYTRPRYGDGGALAGRAAAIAKIAL
ncbi:MAG: hypothetical protein AAFP17_17910 [Pseudomonadota bacterium]